ncbi:ABC transporter ATP-binding protein [Oceanobacillus neutriphilus]|uniref:ABC transporter n=1 Tax=Oceanobacillus neutriphilus TaxID=531815 RepID=A0ABQ2NV84_9BACI|nr:ABC transporter ATP-binding protein [Oceanobacillus neutriphilus]GGP11400.1 ABC transporter [Oceanobacillus neutriphilus]
METVLEIKNLNKKYKSQYALKDVSLSIQKGEIYGLIGRNGAGKTTLLKAIVKLIDPTNGQIALFGSSSEKSWVKALRRTGSVIEIPVAYESLSGWENLAYYCKLRGIIDEKTIIQETLDIVGLDPKDKKKFKNYSLGMKQKLGIAIAILSRPDFLILDEPINGLDPLSIVEFRQLLKRLQQEQGMTIIISSHILSELYHVATRFGIIHHGELVKEISKNEFETLSQEYIVLQTSQMDNASRVLKETNHYQIKIIAKDTMHIFDDSNQINHITVLLVQQQIPIDGIYYQKQDLEKYFTSLVRDETEEITYG